MNVTNNNQANKIKKCQITQKKPRIRDKWVVTTYQYHRIVLKTQI